MTAPTGTRLGLPVILLLALASITFGRSWSVNNGRNIEAEFVRVHGSNAVLNWGGRVIQIPLNTLSEEDQSYIRDRVSGRRKRNDGDARPPADESVSNEAAPLPGKSTATRADPDWGTQPTFGNFRREWTDRQGRKITAKFVELEGAKIVVDRAGKPAKIPYKMLSDNDKRFVHRLLSLRGISHDLPDISGDNSQVASIPNAHGAETTEATNGGGEIEEPAKVDSHTSKKSKPSRLVNRTWTATNGKKVRARFLRVVGQKIYLNYRNRPLDIPYSELIAEDQQYVRNCLIEQGKHDLIAGLEPPQAPPAAAIAVAPPPPIAVPRMPVHPPAFNPPVASRTNDAIESIRRSQEEWRQRREESLAESRRRMDELRNSPSPFTQPSPSMPMPAPNFTPPPTSPPSPAWASNSIGPDRYECEDCHYQMSTVPKDYRCPKCGVTFGHITNPDGSRVATGAKVPVSQRFRTRGLIGAVVFICSLLAALWKKLTG
jgi:hypothetical protein